MSKILTDDIIGALKGNIYVPKIIKPTLRVDSTIFDMPESYVYCIQWGKMVVCSLAVGLKSGQTMSPWTLYPLLQFPFKAKIFSQADLNSQDPTHPSASVLDIETGQNVLYLRNFASDNSRYFFRGQIVFFSE